MRAVPINELLVLGQARPITRVVRIMLVLSRRAGESILIGGEVEIIILGTDGGQVRVGIRAPRDITVLRKELLQEMEEENPLAATPIVTEELASVVEKTKIPSKPAAK